MGMIPIGLIATKSGRKLWMKGRMAGGSSQGPESISRWPGLRNPPGRQDAQGGESAVASVAAGSNIAIGQTMREAALSRAELGVGLYFDCSAISLVNGSSEQVN